MGHGQIRKSRHVEYGLCWQIERQTWDKSWSNHCTESLLNSMDILNTGMLILHFNAVKTVESLNLFTLCLLLTSVPDFLC